MMFWIKQKMIWQILNVEIIVTRTIFLQMNTKTHYLNRLDQVHKYCNDIDDSLRNVPSFGRHYVTTEWRPVARLSALRHNK